MSIVLAHNLWTLDVYLTFVTSLRVSSRSLATKGLINVTALLSFQRTVAKKFRLQTASSKCPLGFFFKAFSVGRTVSASLRRLARIVPKADAITFPKYEKSLRWWKKVITKYKCRLMVKTLAQSYDHLSTKTKRRFLFCELMITERIVTSIQHEVINYSWNSGPYVVFKAPFVWLIFHTYIVFVCLLSILYMQSSFHLC